MNRQERRKAGYVKAKKPLDITMGVSGEQLIVNFSEQVHWIGMDVAHAEEFLANFQKQLDKLKMSAISAERG